MMITLKQKLDDITSAEAAIVAADAAASASRARRDTVVGALIVAAAPGDEALQDGEAIACVEAKSVYANVKGNMEVLSLRGYLPPSPTPAPNAPPAPAPAPASPSV